MKAYLMGAAGTAGLYAALKLALPHLTGPVAWLLSGYGADVLAGGMILCLFNCVLLAFRIPPIRRALPAAGFLLLCGLFWEYVTPPVPPRRRVRPLGPAGVCPGRAGDGEGTRQE